MENTHPNQDTKSEISLQKQAPTPIDEDVLEKYFEDSEEEEISKVFEECTISTTKPRKTGTRRDFSKMPEFADKMWFPNYFQSCKFKVEIHPNSEKECEKMFSNTVESASRTDEFIIEQIKEKYFDDLKCYLEMGMSVLIHGVGSKHKILKLFCQYKLCEYDLFIINGYHPQTNYSNDFARFLNDKLIEFGIKKAKIVNEEDVDLDPDIANKKFSKQSTAISQIQKLLTKLRGHQKDIFLVIHCFDHLVNKDPCFQTFIHNLFIIINEDKTLPRIRLIAGMDCLKIGLGFHEKFLNDIMAIFFQIDTFEEYDIEKLYAPHLFSTRSDLEEIGVEYILKSLTKDQIYVIQAVAKYQLENQNDIGISFRDLYTDCEEEIGITNQRQLNSYLAEAKDHKLIVEKKDSDDTNYLSINYNVGSLCSPEILQKIINYDS
ncbi:unnamed protein product [Moneuplotes crassus]|uniref:Origin recognition complex subunit 2 n=1 Tax=Euplotes crassus TaxID=5936 RepID=A0AAD1UL17_EUPCR|nr:unnamed protein product [Moneuplotes crassus]